MRRFMRNDVQLVLACVLLAAMLVGCSPAPVQPAASYPAVGSGGAGSGGQSGYPAQGAYPGLVTPNPNMALSYPGEGPSDSNKYQPIALDKVVAPKDAPKPEAGKASASGILYSKSSSTVLWDFQFYFTPAQGDSKDQVPPVFLGAFKEKGDILLKTDSKGEFQINSIPPGNYYMILVAPGDYQIALKAPTDETPRMVTFKADQAQPLGVILFP